MNSDQINKTFAAIRTSIKEFDKIEIPSKEVSLANYKAARKRLVRALRHLTIAVETSNPKWKSKRELKAKNLSADTLNQIANREMGLDENDWVLEQDWGNK